jgi:hypothetical protein
MTLTPFLRILPLAAYHRGPHWIGVDVDVVDEKRLSVIPALDDVLRVASGDKAVRARRRRSFQGLARR